LGATFCLALASLSVPPRASGSILAFWDFSENGGTTLGDVSGNSLHGSINGSPGWVAGHLGGVFGDYALQFSELATDFVQIPDNALLHIGSANAPFTIGMWVQDSSSDFGEAFCWGTGARNIFWQTENVNQTASYLWSDSNGALLFTWAGLGNTAWHHIAITADGTNVLFYLDAALKNTSAQPNISAWGNVTLGKSGTSIQPWDGKLSDLIILDVAADTNEISQIMNGTYPGMPTLPSAPVTFTWTNPVSGGNWSDTSNWVSGEVASVGNADFSALDILSNNMVHLDAAYTIHSLTFGDTGPASSAGWTVDNNDQASNVLTLTGSVTVNALGAGEQVTINATVAGNNGITKNGPGSLVVSTNVTTGNMTVNGGSLTVYEVQAGSGLSFGGGSLEYAGDDSPGGIHGMSGTGAFLIDVTGAGGLVVKRPGNQYQPVIKGGAGTISIVNGVFEDGGDLTVNGGTVILAGSTAIGSMFANIASVLDVASGARLKLGNANGGQVYYDFTFNMSGGTFDVNGQNPAINQNSSVPAILGSGTISNSAGFAGTAVFKITDTKTFSGNIVDGAGAATVALALAASSGSTPTWVLSGSNTYSGATTLNSATLRAGASAAFAVQSAYTVAGAATLDLDGFDSTLGSLTGAGNVTLGDATLTIGANHGSPPAFSGIISGGGSIAKVGIGTLTFSGANTYTGDTHVVAGVLNLAQSSLHQQADLYLTSGAKVGLDFVGTNTIRSFYVNGKLQPPGTWGASSTGAEHIRDQYFTGGGVLSVDVGTVFGAILFRLNRGRSGVWWNQRKARASYSGKLLPGPCNASCSRRHLRCVPVPQGRPTVPGPGRQAINSGVRAATGLIVLLLTARETLPTSAPWTLPPIRRCTWIPFAPLVT